VEIDINVAHGSRIYDYLLGGTDNFEVDRQAAHAANADFPGGIDAARGSVRANRRFLGRVVRFLGEQAGIRQYLDIGTGIPNEDNTHAVAQRIAPESRVVYVDKDPVVLAHAHTLLRGTEEGVTVFLNEDLRHTDRILQVAADPLDFDQPVAVMLISLLHFFDDDEDPYGIVTRLMEPLAPGSHLAVSHLTGDTAGEMGQVVERLKAATRESWVLRSQEQVARFFDGLGLVEPGLVQVDEWMPEGPVEMPPWGRMPPFHGGIGRKA